MLSWHLSRGTEESNESLIHIEVCGPTVELDSHDYGADSKISVYFEVVFKP